MTGVQFARWSAPESLVSVDYSTVVMEHIRQHVMDGFHRILRGGVEVGGILFGNRDGKRISILAMRPVEIEYASGPVFLLSDKDTRHFEEVLHLPTTEKTLSGTVPVGWFVSHTRSVGVSMTAQDQEIFSRFFPDRSDVTLVLRPGRMGMSRAGFFTRDADGGVRIDAPYREFEVGPSFEPASAEARVDHRSAQAHAMAMAVGSKRTPVPMPAPLPEPLPPLPMIDSQAFAGPRRRSRWLWAFLALSTLVLLGAGAGGWWYFSDSPVGVRPGLGLFVLERGGADLELEWHPNALADADTALIEVKEGDESRLYPIKSRAQIMRGFLPLKRKTSDVNVRFTAYDRQGKVIAQEGTRFLGDAPVIPPSQEVIDARAEVERLKTENARLQVNVELWTLRARQAEVRVRQLLLEQKDKEKRQ